MTVQCKKQLTPFAAYTSVNLAALPAGNGKLSIGYSHASQLSFDVIAAEHTLPIERLAHIKLWDDAGKLDDNVTVQTEAQPLFEGFVEVVAPGGDSNKVNLTAFDPTYRVARELTVMSRPWLAGTVDPIPANQVQPAEGTGAVPLLIYNARDTDEDFAYCVGFNGTIGNVIAGILEYQQEPLFWRNAAPPDAVTPTLSALAYVPAEMTPLSFVPQEKIVWESESVRAGVERVQRYEPRFRMLFEPGTRLWRYQNITASPQVTLRLNDPTVANPVLSLTLTPSFDKAYTALKIYGPPTSHNEEFTWYHSSVAPSGWTNTLAPVDPSVLLETYSTGAGSFEARTWQVWQIVNAAKRAGARELPSWAAVEVGTFGDPKIAYEWLNIKKPTLLLSFDGGKRYYACQGVWFDVNQGRAVFNLTSPYCHKSDSRGQSIVAGSTQTYFPPNAIKLVWAPLDPPLSVRVPATGFEGTAFTVGGLKLEKKLYDPALAIGYEYGTPVTSAARRAQFDLLARSQLDKVKNITWVGGCVLDGIDWRWQRLNRRVSFVAANGSGGTTAAGWDAIDAFVTDVEYDFSEQTTTLTFSSDRAETIGEDVAQMKERLKIKALQQREVARTENIFRIEFNYLGEAMQIWSGLNEYHSFEYVDAQTGNVVDRT